MYNKNFHWQGLDKNGHCISGTLCAKNKTILITELKKQFITPLKISRENIFLKSRNKITERHIINFTTELSILLQAGISLKKSLEITIQNDEMSALKKMAEILKNDLENGLSFTQALKNFPQHFDRTFVGLIQAGEQSGKLTETFSYLVNYQERAFQLKMKLKKAMYYPIFVFISSLLITMGLLLFVVPEFQRVFNEFGAKLPFFTRCIMNAASLLQNHWIFLISFFVTIPIITRLGLKKIPHYNEMKDKMILKLPLLHQSIRMTFITRFCQLMAMTLESGIPLTQAIQINIEAIHNSVFQKNIKMILQQVTSGNALHEAMKNTHLFPTSAIKMIAVGESTGSLALMLTKIAIIFQNKLDNNIDNLSKLFEPIIMAVIAILVGSLIIAMYLPIFKIGAVM